MKNYLKFLVFGLITALIFETNANIFFDGILFKQANAVSFFLVWYGILYSLLFLIGRNKKIIFPVLFFAVLGTVAEVVVFNRLNIFIDPIIYGIMAFVPFWVYKKLSNKVK